MPRKFIWAFVGLAALGSELAVAKTVTCTMASLERTVELRYESAGVSVPCEVRYAKPSEGEGEQVLWRAEHEAGYCEARFDEFVDKLTGFGWSCGPASADSADAGSDATDEVTDAVGAEPEPAQVDTAEAEADTDLEESAEVAEPDTSAAPPTE